MTEPLTPHALPSAAASPRRDDSPLLTALVALALLAVTALVFYFWSQVAPQAGRAVEKYAPATHSAAYIYRLTNPDGSITYRSRNLYRDGAHTLAPFLPLNVFGALIHAAHIDVNQLQSPDALDGLKRYDIVKTTDVIYAANGVQKERTTIYSLLDEKSYNTFALNELAITPPIPVLPDSSSPQTIVGMLNDSAPFTVTMQLETRAPYQTAIGDFSDCVQTKTKTEVSSAVSTDMAWYCAGVGEVYDELTDANGTRRSEIVAASVGDMVRGYAPALPRTDVNAMPQFEFPNALPRTIRQVFQYKERVGLGISSQIVPVDGMLLYGTSGGALVALDRAGEQERWRFQTGAAIFSTPIVRDGIAYFGSADKKVYAVRVSDGAFVWAFRMKDIVSAPPALSGNTVYVASEDRQLYALNASTGQVRWQFPSARPLVASPVVRDGIIYFSNDDGVLYARDAVAGTPKWEFSANSAITVPAVLEGDALYVGSHDENVYALNAQDGALLWQSEVGSAVTEPVVATPEKVFVTLHSEVFALDAATGKPLWRYDDGRSFYGAPLLFDQQLWYLQSGRMIVLDANTGVLLNSTATTESSATASLSSNGREIYAGFFDGTLLGFGGVAP
jgi:outer membrane protein assembly factor BamB